MRKEKVKVIAVKKDAPSCKGENCKNLDLFADFNSVKNSEISESAECAEISDIADSNAAKDGQDVSSGDVSGETVNDGGTAYSDRDI